MLIVVRHGRTAHNAAGRLLGRTDLDLDDEGVAQARAVAEWIGAVDRVVTSPLLRARRTAEAFGPVHEVDERWIELDYGELEEVPAADVPAETWSRWRSDAEFTPGGGESLAALYRRVAAACDELAGAAQDLDILVMTHVSPIKAALAWALGGDVAMGWRTRVGQPSITRIAVGANGPVLLGFNEAPR